ncbi:hypothetical protein F2Q69_00046323 [Brassica cretica]|uniref:Uncharacterized protein n=1 Tax=Brassica cretica TaxID=69181 RepID=A0A8S9PY27_BRACR|nr:hypothetical protein F2Q69_00046323 [Brassica cretica]
MDASPTPTNSIDPSRAPSSPSSLSRDLQHHKLSLSISDISSSLSRSIHLQAHLTSSQASSLKLSKASSLTLQILFLKHLETSKLSGITTPDKVRSKMIYASSNDRFKRELDGIQVDNTRHFSCCSFLGGE